MLVRRESRSGANDLNTVYRPCTIDELLGNTTNKNILKRGLRKGTLRHSFLFTGDAGCGKTTVARIIALSLNCESCEEMTETPCLECDSCRTILNNNSLDVREVNVGQDGVKDAVQNLVRSLPEAPFNSRYKVLVFDEAHKFSSAAQDLLLKVIEDGYSHVYFIFATNQPEKLSEAFRSRCATMHFSRVSADLIKQMLINVAEFEGMQYDIEVLNHITEECRGVPRKALVYLEQVADEGSWQIDNVKNLLAIVSGEEDPNIIEISRALLNGKFKESVKIYDKIKNKTQAESVRISIMSFMVGCLKRAKTFKEGQKFSAILDILSDPIYQQGKPGDYILYNYLFKVTCVVSNK